MKKRKSGRQETVVVPEAEPSFPEYQSLISDLGDLLDPNQLESEVVINSEGQFMTWLADIAQMGVSSSDEAVVSGDLMPVGDLGSDARLEASEDGPREKDPKRKKRKRRASSITPDDAEETTEAVLATVETPAEPAPVENGVPFDAYMAELEMPVAGDLDAAIMASEKGDANAEPSADATPSNPQAVPFQAGLEALEAPIENTVENTAESTVENTGENTVADAIPATAPATFTAIVTPAPSATPAMLRHHFDATALFEGRLRLREVMELPHVPMSIFVGRAADRSLETLPGVTSINLAELGDLGLETACRLRSGDSFHAVLQDMKANGNLEAADLTVSDLSELDVDEVTTPMPGRQLSLVRIAPDPAREGRLRGTLVLVGEPRLRAGAAFLKAVAARLESPITLMV